MIRSSDFPERETELDRSFDAITQDVVEAGHDWRKPYYARVRGIDWAQVRRGPHRDLTGAA